MRASLEMCVQQQDLREAAIHAGNLSELELTLGELAAAVRDAEQSVDLADRSGDGSRRMANRTTLADARHQSGALPGALVLFREAESMQEERQPEYPLLYSLWGFRYCGLLLDDGERMAWATRLASNLAATDTRPLQPQLDTLGEVEQRALQAIEWETGMQGAPLLDFALHRLTLGRVALYRAILERSSFEPARELLAATVDALRAAGDMSYLPRGLLTRAWLRFMEGDPEDGAMVDLDEAWQIAERGAMKLHMADIYLHRARLFRDRAALEAAARLIEETGYHRRDDELCDAQEAAQHWPQQPDYPRTPEGDSSDTSGVATLDAERGSTQDSSAAAQEKPMPEPNVAKPVFISYAHKDNEGTDPAKRWLDRLMEHLDPLVKQENIMLCSDQVIGLGDDWHGDIQAYLNGARAAVLLVSPAFLASKYIRNNELPVLLRNAKASGVKIIPVILRPCLFEETKFKYPDPKSGPEEFTLASLQAAGSPTKALSEMSEGEQDRTLVKVAQALAKVVSENPK